MSTISYLAIAEGDLFVGQLIMLGTLFGLIVLIFGVVVYVDPEARGDAREESDR